MDPRLRGEGGGEHVSLLRVITGLVPVIRCLEATPFLIEKAGTDFRIKSEDGHDAADGHGG